ncbi:MAG TPA: HEPN domain-containing protein [bacterium]
MIQGIKTLSNYRIERAEETFRDAELLLQNNSLKSALNRFYYSAFYAARALLATKGLDSSKHSGVISLFNQHFVKTGIMKIEISKILSKSFEIRQDSDYEDFISISKEEVVKLRDGVKIFIEECKNILKTL